MEISERIKELNERLGRYNKKSKEFFGAPVVETNTFKAITEARKYVENLGYNVGSMQSSAPMGISKKYQGYISKWRNMTSNEHSMLDGYIISNDMRNGNVEVVIWE
jgi:hypothetical protein